MSSYEKDLEKYIFDPQNPKQCKSYNLLLNIAKKKNLVYVSSDFTNVLYEDIIINDSFNEELWDKPDKYEELDVNEKITLFKKSLSEKEYVNHLNLIDINKENFIYNKIFTSFFDLDSSGYIEQLHKYEKSLIISKINGSYENRYSKYSVLQDSEIFCIPFQGQKILFTNDSKLLNKSDNFFDVSSIVVTSNKKLFLDIESNKRLGQKVFNKINKNLKPIFLNNIKDVKLLLNVLSEDLKREKAKNIKEEKIHFLKDINIKNFFSIRDIKVDNLADKKEIYIVGENGDGKSLFLQSLALGLKGVSEGVVFDMVKSQKDYNILITDSDGNKYNSKDNLYKNLFAYGANRNNNCQMKKDESGYLTLFNPSLDLKNPIDWLIYLDHSEKSGKTNIVSVSQAKKLFQNLLNSDVEINIFPESVTFNEKGSIVSFEQLSAGYKGVITIISDLLVRLSENQPMVKDINEFKAIVLIDEVELHLHPKWKYNFIKKLRDIFPLIQFIMTTHSPTVLLGASKEAVFYKIYKEEGEVKISNQINNEGYTNNSLVSSPLFELGTITSRDYKKEINNDDYIYEKIHQRISYKIKNDININEEEI